MKGAVRWAFRGLLIGARSGLLSRRGRPKPSPPGCVKGLAPLHSGMDLDHSSCRIDCGLWTQVCMGVCTQVMYARVVVVLSCCCLFFLVACPVVVCPVVVCFLVACPVVGCCPLVACPAAVCPAAVCPLVACPAAVCPAAVCRAVLLL